MKKFVVMLLVAATSYMGMLQCIGTNALFTKVNTWNVGLRDKGGWGWKFLGWIVFLVFWLIIPVYAISFILDLLLFNSIEFWTGSNLISYNEKGEATKVANKGDEKAIFHYTGHGENLQISIFKKDKHVEDFYLRRSEPGVFYVKRNGEFLPLDVKLQETASGTKVQVFEGATVVNTRIVSAQEVAAVQERMQQTKDSMRAFAGVPVPTL